MRSHAQPRLWPLALLLAVAGGVLAYLWLVADVIRQVRIMGTLATTAAAGLLGLLWLLLLAGLSRRARLALAVAVAGAGAAASQAVRFRGVSGDLVPVLAWRWSEVAPSPLPAAPPGPLPSAGATAPAVPSSPPDLPLRAEPAPAVSPTAPADLAPAPNDADYPQFLGPHRNGVLPGPRLHRDWASQPPREVWRRAVGPAWSSFAVASGQAVTQEQRGEEEVVVSYDLATGEVRWFHADRARYATAIAGEGPRATPAISGGRVFTMGATGRLNALALADGRLLWTRDVAAEDGAPALEWGRSGSPLAVGDLVVVNVGAGQGKSLVAYHASTGEVRWSAGHDRPSYSSPLLAELVGRTQVVVLNQGSVAGHDPTTGALLWEHPWPREQPSVSQPLPLPGDLLLVSAGYGVGSKLLALSRGGDGGLSASLRWESPRLKSKFANMVAHAGSVYGLDDGVMVCLDPETGERRWKGGRYGHGQVLLVGALLLVLTEHGDLVLLEPDPRGPRELTRFTVLEGKSWNPPALAGRLLLVRTEREAACYELPVE
jgi:outer membrane protein assembly factor BamB